MLLGEHQCLKVIHQKRRQVGFPWFVKSGEHCIPDHILEVDNTLWHVKALRCPIVRELFHILNVAVL